MRLLTERRMYVGGAAELIPQDHVDAGGGSTGRASLPP